jgi:hypothetical protein
MAMAAATMAWMGAVHAQNIIQNGDFSSGNPASSDYTYVPYDYADYTRTPRIFDGRYTIGPHVPPSYFDWAPFHTVSGGNTQMLIANGAASASQSVWNQSVKVLPGTIYKISFYLAEISAPGSVADIAVDMGGGQIGHAAAPSVIDTWKEVNFYWYSGSKTGVRLALKDLNTGGVQNDFAIDNISMSAMSKFSSLGLLVLRPVALGPLARHLLLPGILMLGLLALGLTLFFVFRRWTSPGPEIS